MKKMNGIMVTLLTVLFLAMMPANASDVSYQIRSSVYDNTDSSIGTGDFYWDADGFSGFWYQIKPGLSSELLYFDNNVNSSSTFQLGDEIAEGDLYYLSKPQVKKTKIGGSDEGNTYVVDDVDLKKYYLMGFFGSQYVVMPADPSALSAGCKPDRIAKILMEQDSDAKKQMFSGEEWQLTGGWSLVAQQVDVEGNKVWVELKKNGETIDSDVISAAENLTRPQRTYLYKDNDDYPVFYCYVDSIFRGSTSDFVVFKYAFLRGDVTIIESGDSYGAFDVEGFEVPAVMNGTDYAGSGSGTVLHTGDAALVMASSDDITLDSDETFDLYGGMYLKTEDTDSPCLKMTLWKKCTIAVPDQVVEEPSVEEEEIVVIDMAEDEDGSKVVASVKDETGISADIRETDDHVMESSVSAPGFELLFGLMGLLGASMLRKF